MSRRTTLHVLALGFALGSPAFAQTTPSAAASVRTASLESIAVRPLQRAPATVVSLNDSTISAEIDARVSAVMVRVGDRVKAGATLVEFDCRGYVSAEREAEARVTALDARLALARRQVERANALERAQHMAEELRDTRVAERDATEAERRAALAQREQRRIDVQRCRVTSPFDALVTARLTGVGSYATRGTALVRVLDLSAIEISAQIPYAAAADLARDTAPVFEFGDTRYPVKVRHVLPAIQVETRNREVRLEFVAAAAPPGAAGKLEWRSPAIHVPGEFLVKRGDTYGIFTAANGTARFVPLPAADVGRPTAVELPATTAIVVEGQFGLADGQPLSVKP